jgi:DNA repair protein SbcD/Mre11
MAASIRILLLADSHLGFDLPAAPRTKRRRRGHDFLANYATALKPAFDGDVDVVVHGGDVFDRPRVPPALAWQGLEPLARIADRGVPVFVVPGNHERSRLPHERFASHPNVRVFDRPRTFTIDVHGVRLALSGFPFERRNLRARFPALVEGTGWRDAPDALRLLLLHQCVEGATVGPGDFTFTSAPDVIRAADIPAAFAAVFSGHIHRHQVLTRDLRGRPLAAPVMYPGSIERTSLAEMGEPKGFMIVDLPADDGAAGRVRWELRRLPARPMVVREITPGPTAGSLEQAVRRAVASAPADAVLRIRVAGPVSAAQAPALRTARLRAYVPDTMSIEIRTDDGAKLYRRKGDGPRRQRSPQEPAAPLQLELG